MMTKFILIMIATFLTVFILSYIIGSIPTGYLIVKKFKNVDIRETGSGSTGATNVKRLMGTKWFFVVLLIDALKGIIPVLLAYKYGNFENFANEQGDIIYVFGIGPVLAALGAIIGHSKSIFLGFTGGKSVATGIGALVAICWPAGLAVAAIWGIITYTTKYVSLGSIIAVSLSPIIMTAIYPNVYYICFAALGAIYVIIRHKENIKRLIDGTENKVRK